MGLRGADRLHDALLQHAQQLDLQGGGQVLDAVQDQGSSRGPAEAPRTRPVGSGERARLVSEELGLQQSGREGRWLHDHQGTRRARAQLVEPPRSARLSRAGLPHDEHRGLADRRPLEPLRKGADGLAFAVEGGFGGFLGHAMERANGRRWKGTQNRSLGVRPG